jgi:integrase
MGKLLTASAIKRLKSDPIERREVPDAGVRGLYLIVQSSGSKSWAFRYRFRGKPCKLTLGSVIDEDKRSIEEKDLSLEIGGAFTLAGARQLARIAANDLARGLNPAARKAQRSPLVNVDCDLFKNVAEDFAKRHLAGLDSGAEFKRLLDKLVLPHWSEKNIQDITKRDVIDLLDSLKDRGMTVGANRVFATVRKLMNWAVGRDIIKASPCNGITPPAEERSRDRILSDDEIRWFCRACEEAGYPFGPLLKLLLLTGQRLSEVAHMTYGELRIKDRLWTIPRQRAKNDRAHDVPLSDAAIALIEALPKIYGKAGYLFTTTGETPVSGFSRAKRNLDKAMLGIARKETGDDELEIPNFWLHDTRRTAASGMARLGINLPVIEKVLNHTSGSFAGIVGVYQRHNFADEKRSALEVWGRFITSLVEDRSDHNVVELRQAAP